jgi:23S rRNA pseudouridine1911/1915/1917 synthase
MPKKRQPVPRKPAQQDKQTLYTIEQPAELMKFLLEKLANKGRNSVKSLLARGQVQVNGKVVTQYNYPLEIGQQLSIQQHKISEEEKPIGLRILHEDEDIIVIVKEAGLLSIAAANENELTAYRQLTDYVRRTNPKQRIFIVHRLDRDTSGVMLFAKNEQAQQTLQNNWQEAVMERTYVALVQGAVKKPEGTIVSWLKESKTLLVYSSRTPNDGQKAITHYKVLHKTNDYSLLEINLETGRKNQIRVHMQDIGHPVIGDKKYGSTKNNIGRLGLHARVLAFKHPTTGTELRFETEIPGKFLRFFQPKEERE